MSRSQGLDSGDVVDSDDDDDDGAVPLASTGKVILGAVGEEEGEEEDDEVEMEQEDAPPRVDADGWETVIRGAKKSSGGGKRKSK